MNTAYALSLKCGRLIRSVHQVATRTTIEHNVRLVRFRNGVRPGRGFEISQVIEGEFSAALSTDRQKLLEASSAPNSSSNTACR